MKKLITILLLAFSFTSYGQIPTGAKPVGNAFYRLITNGKTQLYINYGSPGFNRIPVMSNDDAVLGRAFRAGSATSTYNFDFGLDNIGGVDIMGIAESNVAYRMAIQKTTGNVIIGTGGGLYGTATDKLTVDGNIKATNMLIGKYLKINNGATFNQGVMNEFTAAGDIGKYILEFTNNSNQGQSNGLGGRDNTSLGALFRLDLRGGNVPYFNVIRQPSGTDGIGTNEKYDFKIWDNGNVTFGDEAGSTSAPPSKVTVTGNIETTGSTNGIFMRSPNGTRYKLTVSDAGAPVFTAAP